jgi:hypothetical protein
VIEPDSANGLHGWGAHLDGHARGPRPLLPAATRIHQFAQRDIVNVVTWILSDGIRRTDDELIREVMHELGFHRLGRRVHKSITAAIGHARARRRG